MLQYVWGYKGFQCGRFGNTDGQTVVSIVLLVPLLVLLVHYFTHLKTLIFVTINFKGNNYAANSI